jgi:tetratricopeptide (TPR) repeat protein
LREESDSPAEQQTAWTALLNHYVRGVERCAELLYPGIVRLPSSASGPAPRISSSAEALAWLDAERPNLTAAIRHAAEHGPAPMAWQLADALRGYLWIGQHVGEWLATAHHGLQAAQASAHRPAEAAMHGNLGTLYLRLGEYALSVEHHNQAIELYRALGDKDAEAGVLNNLSLVHRRSGQLTEAKHALVRCLEMLRSADSVSNGLYNLGQLAVELGEIDGAVDHFSQALALAPNADSHTYLGMALRLQGRFGEARDHLERALEIGNVPAGEAEALENLAALELASGNVEAALSLASRALSLVADGGDAQVATSVRVTLGEIRRALFDFDTAAELFDQALATARRIGYASGEVRALINLAVVWRDLGRESDAQSVADEAARRSAALGLRALEHRARELI